MLGMLVAGMAIAGFIVLILWAVLTYVVKNNYPLIRRMAFWAARLENFLPLLILAVIALAIIPVLAFPRRDVASTRTRAES